MKTVDLVPVSVIIPCYNSSRTISRALKSVFNQSKLPKEVIIIDDFSDDKNELSEIVTELFQNKPVFFKIIFNTKNCGPASSRNFGWDIAKYKYIAFLDSDDTWHNNKIEIQYNWMLKNSNSIFSGHSSSSFNSRKQIELLTESIEFSMIKPKNLVYKNLYSTSGVMLIREIKHRFPCNTFFAEDYYLWAKLVCLFPEGCFFSNSSLAFSYKDGAYSSGLSSNLYLMEKAELKVINFICQMMDYNNIIRYSAFIFSLIKFFRRVVINFKFIRYGR